MVRNRFSTRNAVIIDNDGVCNTQQHMANDANINQIMAKYQRTGIAPVTRLNPMYGDFSNIRDYHDTLNRVRAAEEEFDSLPASVRKRFQQDPGQLVEFLSDKNNRDEAVRLGLIEEVKKIEPNPKNDPEGEAPSNT